MARTGASAERLNGALCVTVRRLSGEALELQTYSDTSATDFKFQLCKSLKMDPWQFVLLSGCALLEGCSSLSESLGAEICENGNCEVSIMVRRNMPIVVRQGTDILAAFLRRCAPCVQTSETWWGRPMFRQAWCESRSWCHSAYRAWLARSSRAKQSRTVKTANGRKVVRPAKIGKWFRTFGGPRPEAKFVEEQFSAPTARSGRSSNESLARVWPRIVSVPEDVKQHIKQGNVSFNAEGSFLLKALHQLRGPALTELFQLSVHGGAEIDAADECGLQPLHLACALGRGELVMFLLRSKADPTACSNRGRKPLHYALEHFNRADHCLQGFERDDSALAKACCEMLRPSSQPEEGSEKLAHSLVVARARLAHAATELALFKPWGARITKDEVLDKASVSRKVAEQVGANLWMGWPHSFLGLCPQSSVCCKKSHSLEPNFVQVRWRLWRNKVFAATDNTHLHFHRDSSMCRDYDNCDFDAKCDGAQTWEDDYLELKRRHRLGVCNKCRPHRNARRPQRVCRLWTGENASAKASRSSRLARRGCRGRGPNFVENQRQRKGATTWEERREEIVESEELARDFHY